MRILVVEDDAETASGLADGLTDAGHVVAIASDGAEGFVRAMKREHDVLIVDRLLPSLDGLVLLRALRGAGVRIPALFLTAVSSLDDRIAGLKAGGDDYLTKPFVLSELLARLDALTRRTAVAKQTTTLRVGSLEIDYSKLCATREGKKIPLKAIELRLLNMLMRNAGCVVTRTMLLEEVWNFHFDPRTNIVDSHICRLRVKIDKDFPTELIATVRNAGYKFNA